MKPPPPRPPLFPYTTLFRSRAARPHPPAAEPIPIICLVRRSPSRGHLLRRGARPGHCETRDRKSTRLNSSHRCISYAVFCLKKKTSGRVQETQNCPVQL